MIHPHDPYTFVFHFYRHSLKEVINVLQTLGSLSVCLSRFRGVYLGYNMLDFHET